MFGLSACFHAEYIHQVGGHVDNPEGARTSRRWAKDLRLASASTGRTLGGGRSCAVYRVCGARSQLLCTSAYLWKVASSVIQCQAGKVRQPTRTSTDHACASTEKLGIRYVPCSCQQTVCSSPSLGLMNCFGIRHYWLIGAGIYQPSKFVQ